jgi:hypothetical protein
MEGGGWRVHLDNVIHEDLLLPQLRRPPPLLLLPSKRERERKRGKEREKDREGESER